MAIAIVSGYFNPLLSHHIRYINAAKEYGAVLVIVNNNKQVRLKGSYEFLDENERLKIVSSLKSVSYARLSIDEDSTVVKTLESILKDYKSSDFWFLNGGDREAGKTSTKEEEFCRVNGIKLAYGVGGGKTGSSSRILQDFLNKNWKHAIRGLRANDIICDDYQTIPFYGPYYQFQEGCISSWECSNCKTNYVCDTNKAKNKIKEGNTEYIYGPCACGFKCPKCPDPYTNVVGWYSANFGGEINFEGKL